MPRWLWFVISAISTKCLRAPCNGVHVQERAIAMQLCAMDAGHEEELMKNIKHLGAATNSSHVCRVIPFIVILHRQLCYPVTLGQGLSRVVVRENLRGRLCTFALPALTAWCRPQHLQLSQPELARVPACLGPADV